MLWYADDSCCMRARMGHAAACSMAAFSNNWFYDLGFALTLKRVPGWCFNWMEMHIKGGKLNC